MLAFWGLEQRRHNITAELRDGMQSTQSAQGGPASADMCCGGACHPSYASSLSPARGIHVCAETRHGFMHLHSTTALARLPCTSQ